MPEKHSANNSLAKGMSKMEHRIEIIENQLKTSEVEQEKSSNTVTKAFAQADGKDHWGHSSF